MSEQNSEISDLVWLYRLHQAPLLVQESGCEPFLLVDAYHMYPADCPCLPWVDCPCSCHSVVPKGGVSEAETPVP